MANYFSIAELVKPCCTVLDDSIGCALWFAARGYGNKITNGEVSCSNYRFVFSFVRVILKVDWFWIGYAYSLVVNIAKSNVKKTSLAR